MIARAIGPLTDQSSLRPEPEVHPAEPPRCAGQRRGIREYQTRLPVPPRPFRLPPVRYRSRGPEGILRPPPIDSGLGGLEA